MTSLCALVPCFLLVLLLQCQLSPGQEVQEDQPALTNHHVELEQNGEVDHQRGSKKMSGIVGSFKTKFNSFFSKDLWQVAVEAKKKVDAFSAAADTIRTKEAMPRFFNFFNKDKSLTSANGLLGAGVTNQLDGISSDLNRIAYQLETLENLKPILEFLNFFISEL